MEEAPCSQSRLQGRWPPGPGWASGMRSVEEEYPAQGTLSMEERAGRWRWTPLQCSVHLTTRNGASSLVGSGWAKVRTLFSVLF